MRALPGESWTDGAATTIDSLSNVADYDPMSNEAAEALWEDLAALRTLPVRDARRVVAAGTVPRCGRRDKELASVLECAGPRASAARRQRYEHGAYRGRSSNPEGLATVDRPALRAEDAGDLGAEQLVRAIANDLIDQFIADGSCEFVDDFALIFPAHAFLRFAFGVGSEETSRVMRWLDEILTNPAEPRESMVAFFAWSTTLKPEALGP